MLSLFGSIVYRLPWLAIQLRSRPFKKQRPATLAFPLTHSLFSFFLMFLLLSTAGTNLAGSNVVVLGRSDIVGTPVCALLRRRDATVTQCHSRTKGLEAIVSLQFPTHHLLNTRCESVERGILMSFDICFFAFFFLPCNGLGSFS